MVSAFDFCGDLKCFTRPWFRVEKLFFFGATKWVEEHNNSMGTGNVRPILKTQFTICFWWHTRHWDKFNKILKQQNHSGLGFAWFVEVLAALKSSNFKASLVICVRILTLLATRLAFVDNWEFFTKGQDVVVRKPFLGSLSGRIGVIRDTYFDGDWDKLSWNHHDFHLPIDSELVVDDSSFGILNEHPEFELFESRHKFGKHIYIARVSWYPLFQECNREEFKVSLLTTTMQIKKKSILLCCLLLNLRWVLSFKGRNTEALKMKPYLLVSQAV